MPSHRADTPADAPTALRTRPSAHPTHPPLQRRRDLRARPAAPAPHPVPGQRQLTGSRVSAAWAAGWPEDPPALPPTTVLPADLRTEAPSATTAAAELETVGTLALDPLFVATPSLDVDAGLVGADGPLAPVQPLRRPRGKDRAQAQTTRRGAKAAAERAPRRSAAALPQAGIAGALGIATIAVPLAGALGVVHGSRPAEAATHAATAAALTPLPPFTVAATPSLTALGDRRLLPVQAPVVEVPSSLASRARVTQSRASRSAARPVLPGCDGRTPDVRGVQNGRLPASMLCTLWDPKRQLRSDAAVALAKLNAVYTKHFGHPICFNDAYRSLAQQYRIKALRGGYAARPGTSEHGWGLAADLCGGVDDGRGSATYDWLRANAPAFGWDNPTWARSGGSGPYEPWHWEFMPGEQDQSKGD